MKNDDNNKFSGLWKLLEDVLRGTWTEYFRALGFIAVLALVWLAYTHI